MQSSRSKAPPSQDQASQDKPPPRRRNPVETRRALLDASIAEFAENGLAGARVDAIAKRAGVNKQLVYHYYGSKDDLFTASLEEVYRHIRTQERELELHALEPVAAMERLVGFSFDYLADHPEFITLLNDENRMRSAHLKDSRELVDMHSPLVEVIATILERGVEQGVFNDRFGPVNLYISIASLSYFYFSNNSTLSAIFNRDMSTPAEIARRRQHIIDLVLHALCSNYQPTG
ncbi:TetR/AcrR family transcriptional regulator [Fodinicurvata fenggangensis]|uniref:TetR/AcrR family transcriptional regulator n=1 Tax=Fodinicurvata fenggangensis TaxID=1121830 RepID=UPI0005551450|nr:TetR/AcrR family transcriptional regulator [Fodinicurvata fenggangensis]